MKKLVRESLNESYEDWYISDDKYKRISRDNSADWPQDEGEYENISNHIVNQKLMKANGISDVDIHKVLSMVDTIAQKIGDKGTCVIGSGLKINGKIFIEAYSQGNLGPEEIYQTVQNYLSEKYPEISFDIEYGRMD